MRYFNPRLSLALASFFPISCPGEGKVESRRRPETQARGPESPRDSVTGLGRELRSSDPMSFPLQHLILLAYEVNISKFRCHTHVHAQIKRLKYNKIIKLKEKKFELIYVVLLKKKSG